MKAVFFCVVLALNILALAHLDQRVQSLELDKASLQAQVDGLSRQVADLQVHARENTSRIMGQDLWINYLDRSSRTQVRTWDSMNHVLGTNYQIIQEIVRRINVLDQAVSGLTR